MRGLVNTPPGPPMLMPTAVQNVNETHETPIRTPPAARTGIGAVWPDHDLPFQRCTSTSGSNPWEAVEPTAMHDEDDVQETALSPTSVPARYGLRCIDQSRPFQRSATGL
jgi:hypothetical protein